MYAPHLLVVCLCNALCGYRVSGTSDRVKINVAASFLLPSDCWNICYEFLGHSIEIGHFRLISKQHDLLCRSLFRRKLQFFNAIFDETTRQKRIRSWADIEGKIPFNPLINLIPNEWQWISTPYISLLKFHVRSNQPIVCGISYFGTPFVSFYLENLETDHNGTRWQTLTILVCTLKDDSPQIKTAFIYDESRHPSSLRNDSFGMMELDQLLDGKLVRLPHTTGWLSRHWRLKVPQRSDDFEVRNWVICLSFLIVLLTAVVVLVLYTMSTK